MIMTSKIFIVLRIRFEFLKNKRDMIFLNLISKRNKILKINIVYTVIIGLLTILGITLFELWLINNLIKNNIPVSKFVLCNNAFLALIVGLFSFIEQIIFNNRSMIWLFREQFSKTHHF